MRSTRPAAILGLAVLAVLLGGTVVEVAWARCLPSDLEGYEAAQEAIAVACDCASAASHASYVACVRGVIDERVAGGLRARCATQLRRCNRKSTCGGSAGAVRCCRPREPWPRCGVARSAERCREIGGTPSSSIGTTCCDACAPANPCRVGDFPACGGACPSGGVCQAVETSGPAGRAFCVCADAGDVCPSFDPRCGPSGASAEVLDCSCPGGATHSFFTGGAGVECSCSSASP